MFNFDYRSFGGAWQLFLMCESGRKGEKVDGQEHFETENAVG